MRGAGGFFCCAGCGRDGGVRVVAVFLWRVCPPFVFDDTILLGVGRGYV